MMNEQKQWVHGSLFSGIGGFDLAAQWMGWRNAFHCEMDPFCQKVLQHHWPDADLHPDVKKMNGKQYADRIDILTGGFPCQPYSAAGKREGKNDERHLWPEMLRIIREISPTWVVGENVHGLLNWSKGLVFTEIIADMEAAGYWIAPYLLPAAGVNAPHQRNRIFFICRKHTASHTHGTGARIDTGTNQRKAAEVWRKKKGNVSAASGSTGAASHTHMPHAKHKVQTGGKLTAGPDESDSWFKAFPSFSPLCDGNDGIPSWVDSTSAEKWRRNTLKAMGNAVVPPLIYQIFCAIEDMEQLMEEGITQISWDEFQQYQNTKDEAGKAK
jgi:DNA (cytosine-5)-methyltransferase 1